MRKFFYVLMLITCVFELLFTVSCDDTKSYDELKSDEQKLIKKILAEKKIEVLNTYPSDGVFGEDQFVKLESGIYLNVVDSGNGHRAKAYNTDVLIRCICDIYEQDTAYTFNTFSNNGIPMEFKYGYASVVINNYSSSTYSTVYPLKAPYYFFLGTGIESILSYVGDSAIVKLIVPGYAEINSYTASSSYQSDVSTVKNYFTPLYFDKLKFTFY